jgi:hypothetical protein
LPKPIDEARAGQDMWNQSEKSLIDPPKTKQHMLNIHSALPYTAHLMAICSAPSTATTLHHNFKKTGDSKLHTFCPIDQRE